MTGQLFEKLLMHGKRVKVAYELPYGQIYIRPLTDWEFDEIDLITLNKIPDLKSQDYLVQVRTGRANDLTEEELKQIDFPAVRRARLERTYWILLRSACDHYDDLDFDEAGLEKIKELPGAIQASIKVLELSGRTLKSQEGVKSFRKGRESRQFKAQTSD